MGDTTPKKKKELTPEEFNMLLKRLDENPDVAAEKYEELRLKLIKCFVWRGCKAIHADKLADITIDRVARKLGEGVVIKSVGAYACEILRFVWLEHLRKDVEEPTEDEKIPTLIQEPEISDDPDERLKCLRKCMPEVTKNNMENEIIVVYYQTVPGEKPKETRRKLADKWDLTLNHLQVKALRLRKKLEDCINDCMRKFAEKV